MRILLISPNRLRLIVPPLPLGLACLAGVLAPEHNLRVVDYMFAADPEELTWQTVAEFHPEVIGISLRNIDNQDSRHPISYFPEIKEMVAFLRSLTPARIILGGGGFSILPREFMELTKADFGIIGEGETALRDFLAAWPDGDWQQVPGLVWREEDGWRANPAAVVEDLDGLPPPELKDLNPRLYQEAEGSAKLPGMIPVQSRRGCPMRCIYCTTPRLEGRHLRARDPKKVAAWLADWHRTYEVSRFYFVDNMFNCPPDYAKELTRAIAALHLNLEWSCLLNPAFPDAELFGLLAGANCSMVQVGNESGSELVLSNLGKGFGRAQVIRTLDLVTAAGIDFTCFLLLGGPGETRQTVEESVALLEAYQPRLVNLTVGIRIHPGLPLHRIALAEGVVSPEDSLLDPKFYLAPAIRDWIWDYLAALRDRHPNWIF